MNTPFTTESIEAATGILGGVNLLPCVMALAAALHCSLAEVAQAVVDAG